LCGYNSFYSVKGQETWLDPVSPKDFQIPDFFYTKDNILNVKKATNFAMPTFNVMNLETMVFNDGYRPERSMRADSILMSKVMLSKSCEVIVSINDIVAYQRIHDRNDRMNYTNGEALIDELDVINLFIDKCQNIKDFLIMETWKGRISSSSLLQGIAFITFKHKPVSGKNIFREVYRKHALLSGLAFLPTVIIQRLWQKIRRTVM
jgi:hypothetical protein